MSGCSYGSNWTAQHNRSFLGTVPSLATPGIGVPPAKHTHKDRRSAMANLTLTKSVIVSHYNASGGIYTDTETVIEFHPTESGSVNV